MAVRVATFGLAAAGVLAVVFLVELRYGFSSGISAPTDRLVHWRGLHRRAEHSSPAPTAAAEAAPGDDSARQVHRVRSELMGLKMSALRKMDAEQGASRVQMDLAYDSEHPKAAIVALLTDLDPSVTSAWPLANVTAVAAAVHETKENDEATMTSAQPAVNMTAVAPVQAVVAAAAAHETTAKSRADPAVEAIVTIAPAAADVAGVDAVAVAVATMTSAQPAVNMTAVVPVQAVVAAAQHCFGTAERGKHVGRKCEEVWQEGVSKAFPSPARAEESANQWCKLMSGCEVAVTQIVLNCFGTAQSGKHAGRNCEEVWQEDVRAELPDKKSARARADWWCKIVSGCDPDSAAVEDLEDGNRGHVSKELIHGKSNCFGTADAGKHAGRKCAEVWEEGVRADFPNRKTAKAVASKWCKVTNGCTQNANNVAGEEEASETVSALTALAKARWKTHCDLAPFALDWTVDRDDLHQPGEPVMVFQYGKVGSSAVQEYMSSIGSVQIHSAKDASAWLDKQPSDQIVWIVTMVRNRFVRDISSFSENR